MRYAGVNISQIDWWDEITGYPKKIDSNGNIVNK